LSIRKNYIAINSLNKYSNEVCDIAHIIARYLNQTS
jgi:hypothetical protein